MMTEYIAKQKHEGGNEGMELIEYMTMVNNKDGDERLHLCRKIYGDIGGMATMEHITSGEKTNIIQCTNHRFRLVLFPKKKARQ
jgi:hypothetical protein